MADNLFGIGSSALLTFQRGLSTVGHNIANVNTPGYSRQDLVLSARDPFFTGAGFVGQGVEAGTTRRIFDQYLNNQVVQNTTVFSADSEFSSLSSVIDGLLSTEGTSLAPGLQNFFNAVQEVATSPADIAVRQVMLGDSKALVDRFQVLDNQIDRLYTRVNRGIESSVAEINTLAQSLADINQTITTALATGDTPNDLLDRRDVLLGELAKQVSFNTLEQDDGALNVFVGNGQGLVIGNRASSLQAAPLGIDPEQLDIGLVSASGSVINISRSISGGRLGGELEFRDTSLSQSRNELGRIAIGLALEVNLQQTQGIDLDGNPGQQYFNLASPRIIDDPANSTFGTSSIQVQFENASGLTAADYEFSYDGANWTLTNTTSGQNVPLTVSGSDFLADGLRLTPDPGAVAGDRYLIRPTTNGAQDLSLAITDPREIAAAKTHLTSAAVSNTGNGTIAFDQVLNSSDPGFFNSLNIVFDNPPTTFSINAGPSIAYTDGGNIDVNGVRLQISGTPAAGDTFTLTSNQGAVGDGDNALLLAQLQQALVLNGGNDSISSSYEQFVGSIATRSRQAELSTEAQAVLLDQSIAQQQSVSGVNLDEEAINLQKFQQAYNAAARLISVADETFNTLLQAVSR